MAAEARRFQDLLSRAIRAALYALHGPNWSHSIQADWSIRFSFGDRLDNLWTTITSRLPKP